MVQEINQFNFLNVPHSSMRCRLRQICALSQRVSELVMDAAQASDTGATPAEMAKHYVEIEAQIGYVEEHCQTLTNRARNFAKNATLGPILEN